MGTRSSSKKQQMQQQQRFSGKVNNNKVVPTLTPLMEGPDVHEMQQYQYHDHGRPEKHDSTTSTSNGSTSSWEVIREWFGAQRSVKSSGNENFKLSSSSSSASSSSTDSGGEKEINGGRSSRRKYKSNDDDKKYCWGKKQDLRLLLGVLGCPLAPIPLDHHDELEAIFADVSIEKSKAHYIIQQYLAASGCLKASSNKEEEKKKKNMYASGMVNMRCCETEVSTGKNTFKTLNNKNSSNGDGEKGCFVVWQMGEYSKWSVELCVGSNSGVLAGSDGTTVWRHTPWLGTHAAKGPHRPLRRLIQGLDPKSTGKMFRKAECIGEKRIGEEECFVLRVAADRDELMERNEGGAEVIRHVLYGYFSQKTGLLLYLEDSHLTRVVVPPEPNDYDDDDDEYEKLGLVYYWETSIGSSIGDYREVDGVLIAHEGRTVATLFRFEEKEDEEEEEEECYCTRTRLEEVWKIDDVVFNVPGVSFDSFLPPSDLFLRS